MWQAGGHRLRRAGSGPRGESLLFNISSDLLKISSHQRWPAGSLCTVGPPLGAAPGRPCDPAGAWAPPCTRLRPGGRAEGHAAVDFGLVLVFVGSTFMWRSAQ